MKEDYNNEIDYVSIGSERSPFLGTALFKFLANFPAREVVCQLIFQQHEINQFFISSVLFRDEAGFHKDDIMNFHNSHFLLQKIFMLSFRLYQFSNFVIGILQII
jgi:hypothetical protein